ncbi:hypothetical protein C8R43DRAFT_1117362 [Mycena crocata]|nr:hypothetical protein C8R43DRAFT_1117362 [Mycena crocata]
MRMTPDERAQLHGAYNALHPKDPNSNTLLFSDMAPAHAHRARRLIGQSSAEEKRAHVQQSRQLATLRRVENRRHEEEKLALYTASGWHTPETPTEQELARRARREKRDQRERELFAQGRAHEREVIAQQKPPSLGATRLLTPAQRERRARLLVGERTPRQVPLTLGDLYVDGVFPPLEHTTRKHQECSLCGHVKCHPVSFVFSSSSRHPHDTNTQKNRYRCGHSNCYACIHLHLETDWRCPSCETVMQQPPHRHDGKEQSIHIDYPNWVHHA